MVGSTQLTQSYSYDQVGNILTMAVASTDHLGGAMRALQVVSGQNPAGVSTTSDVNHDSHIGLEEAIDALNKQKNQ